MRVQGGFFRGLGVFLAAMLGIVAAPRASDQSRVEDVQTPAIRSMTDAEQQSTGCVVSAAATMGATLAVGPSEIVMLVVGGLIVPSSSSVLYLTLMGTMASLSCAAGATITPLVTRLWRESQQDPEAVTDQTASAKGVEKPAEEAQKNDDQGLSDSLKQGIGCVAAGTGSAAYATFAGANETLMIAAGGLLVPSSASTLWLGLISTLVAGTCSLGAAVTPAVLWAYEQKDNIGANLAYQVGLLADGVTRAPTAVENNPPPSSPVVIAPSSGTGTE